MSAQNLLPATPLELPLLPLRDVVVFPHMVIPLFVGRERSIVALDKAMRESKQVLLVAQWEAEIDDPGYEDLYGVGTLSNILQLLKLPDGTVKVLVEGSERCLVEHFEEQEGCLSASEVASSNRWRKISASITSTSR